MTQLPGTFHQLHHEAIPQELTVLLMETTTFTYNPEPRTQNWVLVTVKSACHTFCNLESLPNIYF